MVPHSSEVQHPQVSGFHLFPHLPFNSSIRSASNGIAEFETIFPGYSSDGANHLNILVHTGNSESSGTTHAGQLFFSDFRTGGWYFYLDRTSNNGSTDIVSMYAPLGYDKNTHTRIKNAQDPNFIAANQNGYNAILHEDWIGDDWPAGEHKNHTLHSS